MGIQGTNIGDVTGASVLVIEQSCDNSQLLVSLCRNGSQWLSPVGWTEKQKITLLDCRSQGGKTEIEIPAEYAKSLVTGDTLTLTCSELDLTQDIIWEGANLLTQPIAQTKPASPSLAGGFLSRFKSSKAPEITNTKSEAELRAEEADRAAETYREKMELAARAKEEAQAKALEAAREAEAALKMEAERIAEMERAAKAFEEAERLKQDGIRRVEEERRQEEARKAEEARRIEDARKREEAARVEVERKAALERYEAALDVTQNEQTRLENRLSRLKTDAAALETQKSEQVEILSSLQNDFQIIENKAAAAKQTYKKTASKLDLLSQDLSAFKVKSDSLNTETEDIRNRVAVADSDYLTAQKEAEMAIARAEEKRKYLENIQAEKDRLLENVKTLTEKLETQSQLVSDTSLKTQRLQAKYEKAQADLTNKSMDIEALKTDAERVFDAVQTSRLEIEATQQAVEDCRTRQAAHQDAIKHLEAGGNPENMPEFDPETRFFSDNNGDVNIELEFDDEEGEEKSKGLMGRVRQSFARSKDPEISIEVEDVRLDDVADMAEDVTQDVDDIPTEFSIQDMDDASDLKTPDLKTPELKTEGFVRRHSKSLLAIGTILGGAAILGGGYLATQKNSKQTLTVKSSSPASTKIVSAASDVKIPAIKTPEAVTVEQIPPKPALETSAENVKVKVVEAVIPDIPLPNLTLTGQSLDNVALDDVPLDNVPVKIRIADKPSIKPVEPKKTIKAKAQKPKNYPELTTRVQRQLQTLGFYNGALNGQQTQETKEAIKMFQELYSLPPSGLKSGKFLTTLNTAETRHKEAQKYVVVTETVPKANETLSIAETSTTSISIDETPQYAETSFSAPVFYDTVTSVPTEPVIMESLPSVQSYSAPQVTVQEAEAPTIAAPTLPPSTKSIDVTQQPPSEVIPPVQDVIIEAKRLKPARAEYPRVAAAKNYFVDARIVVAFDIDTAGKVVNSRILTNDHMGRFNSAFERAALNAVKNQKYSPKTINGTPVATTGQTQRIVFKPG